MFHDVLKTRTRFVADRLRRFARDEAGFMMGYLLATFLIMLYIGGLAVDLMRYENVRNKLQNTTDRAVLAATKLSQNLVPKEVVVDYFTKANLIQYVNQDDIIVDEGMNYRVVSAEAQADLKPVFAQMVGIPRFDVPAFSQAEQRINDIEVAVVLDVSGSMQNTPARITNLKIAMKNFIDTVLGADDEKRISIAMVPYNGQVNIGPTLTSKFTMDPATVNGVANANCVDLPATAYNTTSLSLTTPLSITAYADTFSGTSGYSHPVSAKGHPAPDATSSSNTYYAPQAPAANNRWCPPQPNNIVRLPNNDIGVMKTEVDNLVAVGATSINAGLKWGLTLLDPSMRETYTDLIDAGEMPEEFRGRPFDWAPRVGAENMKVIVLMTDGEHYPEERMNPTYKSGMSPIWRENVATNPRYSIRHATGRPASAGTDQYYWPHDTSGDPWRSAPYPNAGGATQLSWQQVWAQLRVKWVAAQLYGRALGTSYATRLSTYNTWINNFRTATPYPTMDAQLQEACELAKDQNVIIYGIALTAPADGQKQVGWCSTNGSEADPSSTHFYNVTDPADLDGVFDAIANQISQLRLTQ